MNSLTEEEQAEVRILGQYLNRLVNVRDGLEDDRSWYTQVMDDQLQALRLLRADALARRDRGGSLRDRETATRAPPDHYQIPERNARRRSAPREEQPPSRPAEEENPAEPATSSGSSLLNPLTLGALAVGGLVGGALWLGSNLWSATEPPAEATRTPEQPQHGREPESSGREAVLQEREQAEIAEEEQRQRRVQLQLEADMRLARRLQRQEEEELRQSVRVQPDGRHPAGRSGDRDVDGPAASHGERQLNRGAGTSQGHRQHQRGDAARPSDASSISQQRNAGYRSTPEDPMAQFLQALASSTGRGHSQQLLPDAAAPVLDGAGLEIREIVGPGGRRQIMLQMRRRGGAPQANGSGGGGLQERDGPQGAFRGGMLNLDALTYDQLSQLQASVGEEPRGISPDAIACLPTRTYRRRPHQQGQSTDGAVAEHDQCSICLSEYEEGETVRTLPCLHCYHVGCIDNWLQRSKSCPVCKHEVDLAQ